MIKLILCVPVMAIVFLVVSYHVGYFFLFTVPQLILSLKEVLALIILFFGGVGVVSWLFRRRTAASQPPHRV